MAVYKKKRVNRFKAAPKRIKKTREKNIHLDDDIAMSSSISKRKTKEEKSSFKVVKGRKLEQKRRLRILAAVFTVIIATVVILQLSLPVGIGDSVENLTCLIGNGSYPASLSGTDTVNSVSKNGYYYALTNSRLEVFANGGKKVLSVVHGFENPVLKTSATRAAVFEQGGTAIDIYNLKSKKNSKTFEETILTAGIARNGTYAVATTSDKYAGVVSVFDKNDNLLYEWYSSSDLINNVGLSPNGKKLVVSTLNSEGGQYKSNVYVLEYDSATPVFSESFTGCTVYTLDNTSNKGFWIIAEEKLEFVKWRKYETKIYENEYQINMFRYTGSQAVAVFNRSSDRTDNKICVFSSKGEIKYEFGFRGSISDIASYGSHIYCISDNEIKLIDKTGNVIITKDSGFGGKRIAVLSSNKVAVLTDSEIKRIELEE